MKQGLNNALIISYSLFLIILLIYISYNPFYVPLIFLFLFGIITGFFEFREYYNKISYFIALIVLLVVLWVVTIQFSPSINTMIYYIETGIISLLIIGYYIYTIKIWKNNTNALEPYNQALIINPNDITALNNKGVELSSQKKYEKALQCFDNVLKIDPEDTTALYNKSILLKKERKHQNSKKYLDKALELDPGLERIKNSGELLLKNREEEI